MINITSLTILSASSPLPDSRSSARGEGAVGLLALGTTGWPHFLLPIPKTEFRYRGAWLPRGIPPAEAQAAAPSQWGTKGGRFATCGAGGKGLRRSGTI